MSNFAALILIAVLAGLGILALPKKAAASSSPAGGSSSSSSGGSGPAAQYPYFSEVQAAAKKYGVEPAMVAAIIAWEQRSLSSWDPHATNRNDPSYGLGQVTPWMAVEVGVIPTESEYPRLYNPQTGADATAACWAYFLRAAGGDRDKAIQIYNEGETNWNDGFRVPDYLAGVMGYYSKIIS